MTDMLREKEIENWLARQAMRDTSAERTAKFVAEGPLLSRIAELKAQNQRQYDENVSLIHRLAMADADKARLDRLADWFEWYESGKQKWKIWEVVGKFGEDKSLREVIDDAMQEDASHE